MTLQILPRFFSSFGEKKPVEQNSLDSLPLEIPLHLLFSKKLAETTSESSFQNRVTLTGAFLNFISRILRIERTQFGHFVMKEDFIPNQDQPRSDYEECLKKMRSSFQIFLESLQKPKN